MRFKLRQSKGKRIKLEKEALQGQRVHRKMNTRARKMYNLITVPIKVSSTSSIQSVKGLAQEFLYQALIPSLLFRRKYCLIKKSAQILLGKTTSLK